MILNFSLLLGQVCCQIVSILTFGVNTTKIFIYAYIGH